jgi:uncharacterized protein (TIGR01777 family)
MKYIICGGSGFIGSELTEYWLHSGHQIISVGRRLPDKKLAHPGLSYLTWDSLQSNPEAAEEAYAGLRLVQLRTGVVLGNESGAFPKMKLPYSLGFGGRIGSGKQWLSWIHLTDIVRLIDFCILHPEIEGPVNATAPQPVTNEQFGRMIGKVYHRPHWFPVPAFLLKTAVGELSEILLKGQRVLPSKAVNHGFTFTYPTLQPALEQLKSQMRNV